jgi:amino-acid N-acetyltransferase
MTPAVRDRAALPLALSATEGDVPEIVALNNQFSADGLTLPRTPDFVAQHLSDYRIVRGPDGVLWGQVALDEYSPSLCELVSLAVAPAAQGKGLGRHLISAAVDLATRRGYPELFAVSLADTLFLGAGFLQSSIDRYPEKIWRYRAISRSELSIGKKFLFVRTLPPTPTKRPSKRRSRKPRV